MQEIDAGRHLVDLSRASDAFYRFGIAIGFFLNQSRFVALVT